MNSGFQVGWWYRDQLKWAAVLTAELAPSFVEGMSSANIGPRDRVMITAMATCSGEHPEFLGEPLSYDKDWLMALGDLEVTLSCFERCGPRRRLLYRVSSWLIRKVEERAA